MRRSALAVAFAAIAFAGAASANTPVNLRPDPASGPAVTLGDLFDGAGSAAQIMVANGARHVGTAPHLVWSRTGSHMPSRPIMENEQRA